MKDKTCVITGATSGIGGAAALALGALGANLVLIGRDKRRGDQITRRIRQLDPAARVQFLRCDLSIRNDVTRLAKTIGRQYSSIDVLINNAGARFNTYGANPDGIERTFAGNHLGHFQLTVLLLDRLFKSVAGRVICVASTAHSVEPPLGWILTASNYDRKLAYGSSKLANLLFTYELARRLTGTTITVNALDPGGVATRLGLNNGLLAWLRHLAFYLTRGELISPRKAARSLTYLATSPELKGVSGKYFSGKQQIRSSRVSYDEAVARDLWSLSVKDCDLDSLNNETVWQYVAP